MAKKSPVWIKHPEEILTCVDPKACPQEQAPPRPPYGHAIRYFLGLDVGFVKDPSALAIGHVNDKHQICVDVVATIKVGEGAYSNKTRLEYDDVVEWVCQYHDKFHIAQGLYDQWAGIPFGLALKDQGLPQIAPEFITKSLNRQMFQNFQTLCKDKKIVLYDWPLDREKAHCSYIQEILELEQNVKTFDVFGPDQGTDDQADALVRMVWLASRSLVVAQEEEPRAFKPLNIRLPTEFHTRLTNAQHQITIKAGGVPQDFSKVVRHILSLGLEQLEKDLV